MTKKTKKLIGIFVVVAVFSALLETLHVSSLMIGIIVGSLIVQTETANKEFQARAKEKGRRWAFWHEPRTYEVEVIVAFIGFIVGACSAAKMMI